MFQFRRFPTYDYFIHHTVSEYCSDGFPHSEIHGSIDICSSPWLIAACHVLLRLLMPRHSSYALISLTSLVTLMLNDLSFSLSFLFMWVSLVKFLDTNVFSTLFSYPFSIWKNLYFFLLLLRYSVFKQHIKHLTDVWKVNSVKSLLMNHYDSIDQ